MTNVQWPKGRIIFAALLAVTQLAAGCSSGGGGSVASGTPIGAENLPTLFKGTFQSPPNAAPPHQPGKKIYLISCGQSIPFCVTALTGAQEAADALGWEATLIDSKGDVNLAGQGIRQAIAADADGVFVYSLDCQYLKQPLEEAKEAGIPVVTAESRDCNQDLSFKTTPGPQLYTSVVSYVEGPLANWLAAYGEAQAKFILATSGDETKSMSFYFSENGASQTIKDHFTAYLAANCPKCKDEAVTFTWTEAASGLQTKAQQALLKLPGVDVIRVDSDGSLIGGVLAAAKVVAPDARIIAGEGQAALLDVVRQGNTQIAGGVGVATTWEGWAAMDGLVRAFAGQPAAPSGVGIQLWDKEHNVPPNGGYVPPVDFRAKYEQAWGIK